MAGPLTLSTSDTPAAAAAAGKHDTVPIRRIIVTNRRRATRNIDDLTASIREVGLMNPITVTPDMRLVAGGNRLAACKSLGWETIPVTILRLDRLQAELAEIDENLVRHELTALEYDEQLARRKAIYEALHPETRHGAQGGGRGGRGTRTGTQDRKLPFSVDAARKTGVSPSTVPGPIRDRIRDTPLASSKTDLLKLARLRPEQQEAVVAKIVATPTLTLPQAQRAVAADAKRAGLATRAAAVDAAVEGDASTWTIVVGDCVEELAKIEPGSVRLLFADPPYNIGIDYGDHHDDAMDRGDFLAWCRAWIREAVRLLSPDGSMWVLINHEGAARVEVMIEEAGLAMRGWITWYESFGVNRQDNFNRTSRRLLYAVKDPRRLVFHADAVNRPSDRQAIYGDKRADPGGKVWDDVWGINPAIPRLVGNAAERIPDFPTQLPLQLLRAVVGCASDPGDLVVDPFSGSGTTLAACVELGRRGLGIEKSPAFAERSRLRLAATAR